MKKLLPLLFLLGCNQPNAIHIDPQVECEVHYAEDYARDYFGEYDSVYTIEILTLEQALNYCGGSACNNKYHIYLAYPDTREYICQKILHELGHIILWEKNNDPDYEHTHTDFFGSQELNIRGYISYACEDMRIKSLCGGDNDNL